MTVRHRPSRQDRKCLAARPTPSTPNADDIVDLVVDLFASLAMADYGLVAAKRAPPWQQNQRQRGHPGSILFSASGSAINRITAGVKACR